MQETIQRNPSKLRIAFLGSGQNHYDPGIKPLLALTQGLSSLGQSPCLFVLNGGADTVESLRDRLEPGQFHLCQDLNALRVACRAFKPDLVMSDDSITGIRLLAATSRQINALTGVYIHVFYGLHALRPPSSNPFYSPTVRFKLRVARSIPFSLLTARRRTRLEGIDLLIANSQFSEILTRVLYGVAVDDVIYPPIDSTVFNSAENRSPRNGVLVFTGTELDSAPEGYAGALTRIVASGVKLHLVGSARVTLALKRSLPAGSVRRYSGLTDTELADLYRQVQLTFIPQEWEDFGNVGPESLLCGTPVTLLSHQPWMEITGPTEAIFVARSESELVSNLVSPRDVDSLELARAQIALRKALSRESAAKRLMTAFSSLQV
jgi:hypothetical protein